MIERMGVPLANFIMKECQILFPLQKEDTNIILPDYQAFVRLLLFLLP